MIYKAKAIVPNRTPDSVPATVEEQAAYWLKYYNAGGKGTIDKYLEAYRTFVKPGGNNAKPKGTKTKG